VQAVQGNYVLPIVDIVFSPNQQDVIAYTAYGGPSSYIHRWQIKTGKLQRSLELPIDRTDSLLSLSPDGQTFVYGGDVMGYHIGNFQTNQRQRFPLDPSPGNRLTKVVFSPDGQQMAIDRNGQTIEVIR